MGSIDGGCIRGDDNPPGELCLKELIAEAAEKFKIREDILTCVVWQESRGNYIAARFEPRFYARLILPKSAKELSGYVPFPLPTLDTEKVMRSTSYGLCQIMGETARWFGRLKCNYLDVALRDPKANVELGAKYIAWLLKKRDNNYEQALRLYNGSSKYPPIIFDHVKKKKYLQMYRDCG
jgi:soluble lytic murein transglycosylase-like protein